MKILVPFTFLTLLALSWVMADDAITIEICTVSRCESIEGKGHKLLGSKGVVARDKVVAIVQVDGCAACSQVRMVTGQQINVVGSPTDVRCRLYGGDECGKR